jgi:hypothetical protein
MLAYRVELVYVAPVKNPHTLLANNGLGQKVLLKTTNLTYCPATLVTKKKSFLHTSLSLLVKRFSA